MTAQTTPRGWREQYDRMLRWRERLRAPGGMDEHRRDDYYAFFVVCYHLKDWLKNDSAVQKKIPTSRHSSTNMNRSDCVPTSRMV